MIASIEMLPLLKELPASVDAEHLYQAWQALSPAYDVDRWQLPLPLWARHGYDDPGPIAWHRLHDELQATSQPPMCIYLHIPFCSRKCGFCDSYSFQLRSHQEAHFQGYIDHLCRELDTWASVSSLSKRPVPTVHLGGGTPTFLGERNLELLVSHVQECFNTSPSTEWALESNVKHLTPAMIQALHQMGFRRLHLGVQSLQEPVRAAIGRQCTASQVLETIEQTRRLGWVVSVDLICGLPIQTLPGFIADIETLTHEGVNGFSIYELLIYPQNRRWAESYGLIERSHLPSYLMFMAAARLLEQDGFRKNLFNHWADASDANLYFTFPTRGEDLLAAGAIADGVFSSYRYRHPRYAQYLQAEKPGDPGLEGGLLPTPLEQRSQRLSTSLLSAHLPAGTAGELAHFKALDGRPLTLRWLAHGLVNEGQAGDLFLTDNGAWFAGNLVDEINQALVAQSLP